MCKKKFENFAKCALLQAIGMPRHRRSQLGVGAFPFLFGVTESFCKMESEFLNSRVLAGGIVMGCAKKSWF